MTNSYRLSVRVGHHPPIEKSFKTSVCVSDATVAEVEIFCNNLNLYAYLKGVKGGYGIKTKV